MMSSTRFDLVANAIPGVEELTCITQRNSRTAIKDISEAKDPDLRVSMNALQRASLLARKTAIQTNTHIVIVKDGQLLRISANELQDQAAKTIQEELAP